MGRITSGEFNIYGKGKDQIDVATQNRLNNPNGSHTLLGLLLSQGCPQLIYSACGMIAESASGETKQVDSSQTDIVQDTLDAYSTPEGKAVKDAMLTKDKDKVKTALQAFYNKHQTYKPFEQAARTCGFMK